VGRIDPVLAVPFSSTMEFTQRRQGGKKSKEMILAILCSPDYNTYAKPQRSTKGTKHAFCVGKASDNFVG